MHKDMIYYSRNRVRTNDFSFKARDAYDTAVNIQHLFKKRTGWFSSPKPIHIDELCQAYKELCHGMETSFPGEIDKIFNPDIITQLGFPVDENGMVHFD